MNVKKYSGIIIFIALLIIFFVSAAKLLLYFETNKTQQEQFENLKQIVEYEQKNDSNDKIYTIEEKFKILSGYETLHKQNTDMIGWIKIDGTSLSYPVMYTPNDPQYYLHRNFDKEYSKMGVPFIDEKCSKNSGNYIIYGHHMKDGKMFAQILSYADEEFYKEHPVIRFDELNELGSYSVISTFYSKVYNKDDKDVFRYYEYTDISDPDVFKEYIEQVKSASLYETGVDAEFGQQIITLSTCDYHTKNGRFVVVAVENK